MVLLLRSERDWDVLVVPTPQKVRLAFCLELNHKWVYFKSSFKCWKLAIFSNGETIIPFHDGKSP